MNDVELLKIEFKKIKSECDTKTMMDFIINLTSGSGIEYLDLHYSLISENDTEASLYNSICRFFTKHGDAGEDYLHDKIRKEVNPWLTASILQILGSFHNGKRQNETAAIARDYLQSENEILRCRALWVIGWTGVPGDLEKISSPLFNDSSNENRGWAATAMMQIFFKHKDSKDAAIKYLWKAAKQESDDKALTGILVYIQEISGKKFGLSSYSHSIPDSDKLGKIRKKILAYLDKNYSSI